jgi:hypothetical protein
MAYEFSVLHQEILTLISRNRLDLGDVERRDMSLERRETLRRGIMARNRKLAELVGDKLRAFSDRK